MRLVRTEKAARAVTSALGEGGKGIEAGKDIDGGESGDVRRNMKVVTALRLHGKDGDGGERSGGW